MRRVVASAIDGVFVVIFSMIIMFFIMFINIFLSGQGLFCLIIFFSAIYTFCCDYFFEGISIGKLFLNLKIEREKENSILSFSLQHAIYKALGILFVPFCLKRCWHNGTMPYDIIIGMKIVKRTDIEV